MELETTEQDAGSSGLSSAGPSQPPIQKRARVILSCTPCRTSKLKCDRDQPCAQCVKRGLVDSCRYAPRPERKRPAKGMAARLKRLEGMVRDMMDGEGKSASPEKSPNADKAPEMKGQVVQGERATTYVGATHIMAMLEDIEDLKQYFEDEDAEDENGSPTDEFQGTDLLLHAKNTPRNRDELLARLPERSIADRLISRYFGCMSPSQHIVHRPAFTRAYHRFWQNPRDTPLHWIAQLFLMLALGVYFNKYSAPHELIRESLQSPKERIKDYKACAAWALARGKYTQPTIITLPAFLLYVESDFMFSRASQMACYTLSAVCMRLMLKMGLHRDPDKLAGISPFEAEMRRRMWNMAVQVELLVAFHMGLPSIITGVETDTKVPRNLWDEDYDEDSTELPPGRPASEYTSMTYPIHKTKILRVFGKIAQQAHALHAPTYEEVMALDNLLDKTWQEVPSFMKVRPLEECGGETSTFLVQRFGIGALYCKARCVLHRRYLADAVPKSEHDYSRKVCLESALTLLDYQHIIWNACKPGRIISDKGWYVSSLAVHDYLLAGMIVYLVIRNEQIWEAEQVPDWIRQQAKASTRDELKQLLVRSQGIWADVAINSPELRITADTLATMLVKIGCPVEVTPEQSSSQINTTVAGMSDDSPDVTSSAEPSSLAGSSGGWWNALPPELNETPWALNDVGFPEHSQAMDVSNSLNPLEMGITAPSFANTVDFDPSWITAENNMDWRFLDVSLAGSHGAGAVDSTVPTYMERMPIGETTTADMDDWIAQARDIGGGPQ